MFFLKELPTRAMVERYSNKYCPKNAGLVIEKLEMMREASLLVRELDRYFSSHGISQLKFLTLLVIDRELERDWLYASEISERLDVSKPVLSRAIKKLVDDELLQTSKDSNDGRATVLKIADKGQTLLKELLPEYFRILTGSAQMKP
ncbi:MAG: MarR family transcriptional regulator [Acidiferrobacterales bacterium]|nr:MarR family transcriptional regulator [Acidiferrobacterales bacterium]